MLPQSFETENFEEIFLIKITNPDFQLFCVVKNVLKGRPQRPRLPPTQAMSFVKRRHLLKYYFMTIRQFS